MSLTDSIKKAIKRKLPAVSISDSLRTAITAMTNVNASAIVVKTGEEVIGIVTELDLTGGVTAHKDLDSTTVAEVMTACDLITCKGSRSPCVQLDEDETIATALSIMSEAGVHHLLISGNDGNAAGLVSAQDLLKLVVS